MITNFFFPLISVVLSAAASLPALAMPPNEVAKKLDSIIVFAPINTSSDGSSPRALNFNLEGQSRLVYFAAFSPTAVQQIINDRLIPQNLKNAKDIKFAPFSLSKFDSLVQPELKKNATSRVIYVPDPAQLPFAEKLLIKQGASPADAQSLTKSIPVVFCPSPTIKATPNSGPLKDQSFVPCSTDYRSVKDMVDKGNATNAELKQKNVAVVAIPITNFAGLLVKSTSQDVRDIRVLPNPANINVIKSLQN